MLKKTMSIIMVTIMVGILAINAGYVVHKYRDFKESERFIETMYSYGIGIGVPQTIEGSVYGKRYLATYKFDTEFSEVHRVIEWL